jgi:hypothetical protein
MFGTFTRFMMRKFEVHTLQARCAVPHIKTGGMVPDESKSS